MRHLETSSMKRLVSLHGWAGTLVSIFLYIVVLTGAIVVFEEEIHTWSAGGKPAPDFLTQPINDQLKRLVTLIPEEQTKEVHIWNDDNGYRTFQFTDFKEGTLFQVDEKNELTLWREGTRGELFLESPGTALVNFLVQLHVRIHVPGTTGLLLTGILGISMMIAAVTGILIHRHIIRDIFVTKRPGGKVAGQRDAHTLAGIWSLPFAILLAFTGSFLSFATSLALPVVAFSAFGGDQEKAMATVLGERTVVDTAKTGWKVNIDDIVVDSIGRAGDIPSMITLSHYGTRSYQVTTHHEYAPGTFEAKTLIYNGSNGAFVKEKLVVGQAKTTTTKIIDLIAPLHFGNFSGLFVKIIWGALGAAMTYTIVTGVHLWLRRREGQSGWQRCENAFELVVWGIPLACVGSSVGYFVAEPFEAGVGGAANGFLIAMFGLIGWTVWRRRESAAYVSEKLCKYLAISLIALPVVRMVTGGPTWLSGMVHAEPAVTSVDLTLILIGLACLWRNKMKKA